MDDGYPPPSHLAVARIVAPRGVRGEVKAEILTDFPRRFTPGLPVFLGLNKEPSTIVRARVHKGWVLMKLAGYDTPEQANGLRGALVQVAVANAVSLEEGQYFWHQMIGLRVETVAGEDLGTVADILTTGSNDVYVVHGTRGEILLPAIEDVIRTVDLAGGLLVVALPEGLV